MRKIIGLAVLIILCLFISQPAFTQPGNFSRPKDVNAIAKKPLPGAIDKNLVAEGQPKVMITTKEIKNITSTGATYSDITGLAPNSRYYDMFANLSLVKNRSDFICQGFQ